MYTRNLIYVCVNINIYVYMYMYMYILTYSIHADMYVWYLGRLNAEFANVEADVEV